MAEGYWPASVHRLVAVIDSHTHLFLCEGEEDGWSPPPREAGVRRMLNVGLGAETNPVALAAAERHEGVFATVGCHPTERRPDSTTSSPPKSGSSAAHEKVRAIGETGLDYYRETATPRGPAARLRRPDRDRPRARPADRDPRPRPRGRDRRGRRGLQHPRRSTPTGSPVILHCFLAPWRVADAIERGWYCSFSGIVTYPEVRRAARGGRDAARRAAPGRDRRSLPGAAAGARQAEPAGQRRRDGRGGGRGARGQTYEELERDVEANAAGALRLVARDGPGSARTSSPTRTCSTRSSATPSSTRPTSCSRSGPGRGC